MDKKFHPLFRFLKNLPNFRQFRTALKNIIKKLLLLLFFFSRKNFSQHNIEKKSFPGTLGASERKNDFLPRFMISRGVR